LNTKEKANEHIHLISTAVTQDAGSASLRSHPSRRGLGQVMRDVSRRHNPMLLSALLLISGLYAITPQVLASARALFQDELVREADAIAVVRVYAKEVSGITGQIPASSSPDVGLILYSAKTIQKIAGDIPESPILIQFENDESDLNPLAEGTYLIFAKQDGQFFRPLSTEYRITDDQVFWFKKPFETGGWGPEMGMVPLTKALDDIKMLLNKHKNANERMHLIPTRCHSGCFRTPTSSRPG